MALDAGRSLGLVSTQAARGIDLACRLPSSRSWPPLGVMSGSSACDLTVGASDRCGCYSPNGAHLASLTVRQKGAWGRRERRPGAGPKPGGGLAKIGARACLVEHRCGL